MATTAVDIVVKTIGTSSLDKLDNKLKKIPATAKKSAASIDRLGASVKKLGALIGGLAVAQGLSQSFGKAAEFSATETRLNSLTKQFEQYAGIQQVAAQSAEKFGISTARANKDFADLGARLGSSGTSLGQLKTIYEGFNTILATNAVSAQEAASAQLQLNQALGSGRLAGEEFNAINEAAPQLLDEVAKVLEVSRGELKKLASEGKITKDVLIQSLEQAAAGGEEALKAFLDSPQGKLQKFQASLENFQVAIGNTLIPVLTPIIELFGKLLQLFQELPGPIQTTAVAFTALAAAVAILGGPITLISAAVIGLGLLIKKFADENQAFADALQGAWDGFLDLLNRSIAGISALVGSLTNTFSEAASSWEQRIQGFLDFWAGIGQTIVGVWNATIQTLQGAWQAFADYVVSVFSFILQNWDTFLSALGGAWGTLVGFLGQTFGGFTDYLGNAWSAISAGFNGLLESFQINWAQTINALIEMANPLLKLFRAVGIDIGEAVTGAVSSAVTAFQTYSAPSAPTFQAPNFNSGFGSAPAPAGGGGGGGGGGGRGGAGDAEREAQLTQDQLKAAQDRLLAAEQLLATKQEMSKVEQIELERAQNIANIQKEYSELISEARSVEEESTLEKARGLEIKAEELEAEKALKALREGALEGILEENRALQAKIAGKEEEYRIQKKIADLVKAGGGTISTAEATAAVNQNEALKKQAAEADKLKSAYEGLADSIAGELTGAFRSIIDGSKSAEEALADAFQGIADAFLDMAMQMIQEWIKMQLLGIVSSAFGGGAPIGGGGGGGLLGGGLGANIGGSFADGGRPPVGKVSLVGEQGPELFVPDAPGTVLSNEQSKAAMSRYNAGNRYNPFEPEGNRASDGTSRRPVDTPINVTTGPVMNFNGEQYVTVADFKAGLAQAAKAGAKQGEAATLRSLRMSSSTRKKVGI